MVWILQIANVSGAAGDVFVTLRLLRLPRDLLVRDTGVAMTVYSAESNVKKASVFRCLFSDI